MIDVNLIIPNVPKGRNHRLDIYRRGGTSNRTSLLGRKIEAQNTQAAHCLTCFTGYPLLIMCPPAFMSPLKLSLISSFNRFRITASVQTHWRRYSCPFTCWFVYVWSSTVTCSGGSCQCHRLRRGAQNVKWWIWITMKSGEITQGWQYYHSMWLLGTSILKPSRRDVYNYWQPRKGGLAGRCVIKQAGKLFGYWRQASVVANTPWGGRRRLLTLRKEKATGGLRQGRNGNKRTHPRDPLCISMSGVHSYFSQTCYFHHFSYSTPFSPTLFTNRLCHLSYIPAGKSTTPRPCRNRKPMKLRVTVAQPITALTNGQAPALLSQNQNQSMTYLLSFSVHF